MNPEAPERFQPESKGEQLLLEGQRLREAGQTLDALDSINRAIAAFAEEGNRGRFAHAILDRAICYQHLYQLYKNHRGFAVLYRKDAEAMLELIQSENLEGELDQAYFINGKARTLNKDYKGAVEFFRKAVAMIPPERAAQQGDWRTNLGSAMYLNGEKDQGVAEIHMGIAQIEEFAPDEVDSYTTNVWSSGGYLRLAERLHVDDPAKSAECFARAKQIVDADPTQIMRQKQIELFLETGDTGL